MQLLTIGKNQAGQRLDKFLKKALPNAGTGFLYKMLRKKNITLNGKKAEGKEILAQGDEVKCFFSEETYASLSGAGAAEDTSDYRKAYRSLKDISVLYEDENILLLNKPAGVLTQTGRSFPERMADWPPAGCQCHKRNRSCHLPSIGLQPPRPQYQRYRIVRKDAGRFPGTQPDHQGSFRKEILSDRL